MNLVKKHIPDANAVHIDHPQKALTVLQNEVFDMLFLDIRMPVMSGLELLDQVKGFGKDPYTVLITAHRKFNYAKKGIELGVVDYITKPLYPEKIYDTLNKYLLTRKTELFVEFKTRDGLRNVKIEEIVAIKKSGRTKMTIYTLTDMLSHVSGTLNELYESLPSHFHYIKRDCIVNRYAVTGVNYKTGVLYVKFQNAEVEFEGSIERLRQLTIEN